MTINSGGRLVRHGAAGIVAGALVTGGLLALSVPSAQAKPMSVTFDDPGHFSWRIPDGVTMVHITASGGQGASGPSSLGGYGRGGLAAEVTTDLRVHPLNLLNLTVAGSGDGSTGGFGGGGTGGLGTFPGGGGGGASWIQDSATTLIVAGGGGGAAADKVDGGPSGGSTTSGSGRADGLSGGGAAEGTGGLAGAGGSSAGIPMGCSLALAGPAGHSGDSRGGAVGGGRDETGVVPRAGGGGGGGGYSGGGGGGGGAYCASDTSIRHGSGGGGGGGSSYLAPFTQNSTVTEGVGIGDGAITITYDDSWAPQSRAYSSPQPNAQGWWKTSDITVTRRWSDVGSGLAPDSCPSTSSASGRTGRFLLEAPCRDLAGNEVTAGFPVNVDLVAPAASPTTHQRHEVRGWSRGSAVVSWNWADGLSGLDSTSCPVTTRATAQGVQTLRASCQDLAGNKTSAKKLVKIDNTAPRIKVNRPKHKAYHRGQHVVVKFHCRDAGVGVGKCYGSTRTGHALPTKRLGKHTLRVTAKDLLGNVRTMKIHYRVVR
jgi:hypothetical protein